MIKKFFILLLGIIVFWSCEDIVVDQENPLDPGNPDYESPLVNIISGPGEGEVIDEPQVTFAWEGNELVDSYRYRFDANDWSAWLEETSKTFDYLDEGNHSISVQSQYLTGDTSQVENISFMVDAVTGPALMFYPRRQEATVGESVMFQILAEEVTNLTATEFSINFDPAHLAITSVTQGEIFAASEESIFLTQYDNSAGTLSVITAILGGDEPSVAGTGVLIEIQMNVISASSSELTFSGSEVFRDPENNDLTINETVHGMIQSL
jgi:hypothetical protein